MLRSIKINHDYKLQLQQNVFKPVCLTLFLNHHCNLACEYCYIPDKFDIEGVNTLLINDAAEFVAEKCSEQNSPFILGFHGGNEPLLNPEIINTHIETCRKIANKHNIPFMSVCTTNGIVTEKTAEWAAHTFNTITLSWDGPPEIQDRFRKFKDGNPTSTIVQRTASIFLNRLKHPQQLKIRATVTDFSVESLVPIIQYFYINHMKWIELYPVYQDISHSINKAIIPDSKLFVKHFLMARKWAKQNGMVLGYAGSRLCDIHHQYCPILQKNFTITPDGYVTACFQASHNRGRQNDQYMFGKFDLKNNGMDIDWSKLNQLFSKLEKTPVQCIDCFNRFHCAKGCPSICPVQADYSPSEHFDCTIEKWIGLANILEAKVHEIPDSALEDCESFFGNVNVHTENRKLVDA